MATKHIHMGTITRPHGIRGELCVDWYADSPRALRAEFFLQAGDEPLRAVEGAKVRMHKGRPLLTLPHVQDRNAAELLRGVRIYIDRDSLPELSDDEAYLHDILGLTIVDSNSNAELGILENVEFPTESQMLWSIRAATGQEILLPAVEEFIDNFDTDEGIVFVSPPEGLIELYMAESEPKEPKAPKTTRQRKKSPSSKNTSPKDSPASNSEKA